MAITLIAGIAAAGSYAVTVGVAGFVLASAFTAFAIGAGLSLVSRALMPKPDIGTQMGGQSVTTREAAHSRKIVYGRARIGGNIVYLESTGSDNKYLWLVIAVAGHEIDAYESVWFNDEKIYNGTNFLNNWASVVNISFYKGDQTAADSALVSASNSKWTADHKLLDTAYMVLRLEHDPEKFSSGLPNISTIIRGKKVLDPSDNSTAWSQNPALCIYDYLRDTKYGLSETVANILTSSVTTAKGVCDEAITLSAGGTQPRYTIDGVVDTSNSIKANIETMIGSMAGRLVYSGGKFEVHAGEYIAPSITVDESQVIGEITVQTKQSRRNAFNGVKGVFLSEEDNYILADYPAQISSAYAVQDGDPIYLDMALPYTSNNIRAQRLAKLALFRSRQQEAITIPCNLSALRFKIGDNISVTNTRLGYNGKVFEVVGYAMDFTSGGQIVVNVDAIETAASIWDWQASDEEVFLGAGEVELYNGATAIAPTSISVTSDSFLSDDGTFNSKFNVTWTDADDAFTDHYVVEWKLTSSSTYFSQQTKSSPFNIVNLNSDQTYNVRVKAVNELGVSSTYINSTPTAAKDTTAPALPTSFSATAGYKSISLGWTNPSDKDFSNVEVYRATSSGGTFATVATVGGGFGANAEFLNGGLADATTFYYKFRSVDYSGNKTVDENGDPLYTAEVSATTNAAAINGTDGSNTAPVYAYKRSSSTLASTNKPTTSQTWTFADASFGDNDLGNGWTGDIPTGNDDLYICAAVASSTSTTDEVVAADWSAPQVLGTKGDDGTNGYNTAVVYGYKRSASTVTDKPDEDRVWTFSNGTWDSNDLGNSFTGTIPSGTNDLYVCTAVAASQSSTDTVTGTSDWGSPQLLASSGTDGAAGPRNAQGFLYYSVSGSQPSAPTATSFNFSTGDFSGLTADWSRTPPEITGADAAYWATSFTVVEATLDGSQTITFSTPFSSFAFNGLVTFSNLNDELADGTSGSEITTINGGLIKTGTMEADRIRIDGVGIDVVTSGTNKTLIIGNSGVTTVKLDNLAVTTLKIADQAVTIPTSTSLASSYTFNSTTASLVMTLTFTGSGAVAEVLGNFAAGGSGAPYLQLIYHLNDVEVRSRNYAYGGMEAFPITTLDGTNTIKVYARKYSSSGGTVIIAEGYVRTLETKK